MSADTTSASGDTGVPFVGVAGVGLWLPGFPTAAAWAEGARDVEIPPPSGVSLGRVNRRRAGVLGRALADVTHEAMTAAGVDPATVPTVVGSSIGEAATMIGLLDQMWRTKEPMSPAKFTVSVHNAASGLISIAGGNQGFASSLAADFDTPAGALLEGIGLVLTEGQPVVVACADEGAPSSLVKLAEPWGMLAAAVVLVPPHADYSGPCLGALRVHGPERSVGEMLDPAPIDDSQGLNPQAGLVDLIHALQQGRTGALRLDRGAGRGFWVELRDSSGRGAL